MMLLETILDYCHNEYQKRSSIPSCSCNHPSGACSGGCGKCLEQVHYPGLNGKKDYDCSNMVNFYSCKYLYKYASEIYYLIERSSLMSQIDTYHILSIGCGAAPDLVAFEQYWTGNASKKMSYIGYDINQLWTDAHNIIKDYAELSNLIEVCHFEYVDAIEKLRNDTLQEANVIVMQYVISHLYNTGQIGQIDIFFDALIQNVISYKERNNPLIILINDVNSCYRGRDYFLTLKDKLKATGYNINAEQWYFNYNIQNPGQQYGNQHKNNATLGNIPQWLNSYNPWTQCSSAQLLIEVR